MSECTHDCSTCGESCADRQEPQSLLKELNPHARVGKVFGVVSGKGGMSVCLSSESALFTGPPDPQREQFFVYDAEQLAETILDSIQKTLQEGFTLEGGDPDALDIWYYMEGEQPLELPALGLSWPIDQPYQWEGAKSE